jgi:hypothetical protein
MKRNGQKGQLFDSLGLGWGVEQQENHGLVLG